jgi:hypothetical protein
VGLPRESRISRATILRIDVFDIYEQCRSAL